MRDNNTISAKTLLGLLQIKFTDFFIGDCILPHPSMLCISDTIEKYGEESLALKVNEAKFGERDEQNTKIEAMQQLCYIENITHTPKIFINGHALPKEYSVEDLKEALV